MVWRFLQRLLLNDKLIDRLAESYPIRRAAQWVVYYFNKSKAIEPIRENLNKPRSFLMQKVFNKLSGKLESKLKTIKEDLERKSKL